MGEEYLEYINTEIDVMKKLHSQYIVSFHEKVETE